MNCFKCVFEGSSIVKWYRLVVCCFGIDSGLYINVIKCVLVCVFNL